MIDEFEFNLLEENSGELSGLEGCLSSCRSILEELFKIRSDRLSDESLALPPTHFFIMSLLTGFILLGYTIVSILCCDFERSPAKILHSCWLDKMSHHCPTISNSECPAHRRPYYWKTIKRKCFVVWNTDDRIRHLLQLCPRPEQSLFRTVSNSSQ